MLTHLLARPTISLGHPTQVTMPRSTGTQTRTFIRLLAASPSAKQRTSSDLVDRVPSVSRCNGAVGNPV